MVRGARSLDLAGSISPTPSSEFPVLGGLDKKAQIFFKLAYLLTFQKEILHFLGKGKTR